MRAEALDEDELTVRLRTAVVIWCGELLSVTWKVRSVWLAVVVGVPESLSSCYPRCPTARHLGHPLLLGEHIAPGTRAT